MAQSATVPRAGFMYIAPENSSLHLVKAFVEGLQTHALIPGRNVEVLYRWADGKPERLAPIARDLVSQGVSVIAAAPTTGAMAAFAATSTIPIVFNTSDNPIRLGLVASLNHPGGHATGVNFLINELGTKRLELLREIKPEATRLGFLLNPGSPPGLAASSELETVARNAGYTVRIEHVRSTSDVEKAFASLADWTADAAMVIPDGLLLSLRHDVTREATARAIATIYPLRDFVEAGGLISYGTSIVDAFRQIGNYTGRILKGEKASELPVVQSTKFESVVNLKAAKGIGLTIPEAFLLRADEVIE
jgi:putative ABC transport system substrate-binding protein